MSAGDLVIRSGHVVTMDPELGDLPDGDVLVASGRIAAVGTGLDAPGAQEIDARGMIVAPGLVDTHWHMWNTLLRSMSGGMRLIPRTMSGNRAKRPPRCMSHGESGPARLSRGARPGHGCRGRGPGTIAGPRA